MKTPMPISGKKYKQSIDVSCKLAESFDWEDIPLLKSLLKKIESNEISGSDAIDEYLKGWKDIEDSISNMRGICELINQHYEYQLYENWLKENN